MESISTTEFLNLLKLSTDIHGKVISGNILLEDENFTFSGAIIDCLFEGLVLIKNTSFDKSITFKSCQFVQEFAIQNSVFNSQVNFEENDFYSEIKITNATFNGLTFHSGNHGNIYFKGRVTTVPHFNSDITFHGGKYDTVDFSCREIDCAVDFKGGSYQYINFSKCKLTNAITLNGDNLRFESLHVISSDFSDRVVFNNCFSEGTAYFHKVNFNEQVLFQEEFNVKSLTLNNIYAKQNISISYSGFLSWLDISGCEFLSGLDCNWYDSKPLLGSETLSCRIDGIMKGTLVFENIYVWNIAVSCINLGNIIFRNVKTQWIFLTDFINQNRLIFANLKFPATYNVLVIYDSNIGYTEFVNLDFRKFDEFVIAKSEVSTMILSNSLLPKRIQIGTKNPKLGYNIRLEEKINDNIYYRESYRQLKTAMEKLGNKAMALNFKAKEMHYLRKELNWGWDKILLHLNYISNNHGLSWSRGVLFTLLISWLMYLLYNATLLHPDFRMPVSFSMTKTFPSSAEVLNGFSKFIISFPLFKSFETNQISWKTNLVFLLSRIFIGYGVYQTIVAFRKYAGN